MAYSDRYLLFIEYFNKSKFQSAQMILDDLFLDEVGTDKQFYGGLIQIAVALYHVTNENPKGAEKVYQKARGMLGNFGAHHLGIALAKLTTDLDRFFAEELKPNEPNMDYAGKIPRIEFRAE